MQKVEALLKPQRKLSGDFEGLPLLLLGQAVYEVWMPWEQTLKIQIVIAPFTSKILRVSTSGPPCFNDHHGSWSMVGEHRVGGDNVTKVRKHLEIS